MNKKVMLLLVISLFWAALPAAISQYYAFSAGTGTYTAITGTAAAGVVGDDNISTAVDIGFVFPYGANTYTQMLVCSNGYVALGNTVGQTLGNALNSTSYCPVLAALWDDTYVNGSAQYLLTGTAPSRVLTVQFADVKWNYSSATSFNYQIKLYEDGKVEFLYDTTASTPAAATASIGINMLPGGSGNFWSVTPGAAATASDTVENTTIATWPGANVKYTFTAPILFTNDLAAVSVTGSLTPSQGVSSNYTVNVRNNGTLEQTNYSVKLMNGTTELASVAGTAILPGITQAIIIPWIPTSSGAMTIYSKVVLVGDENSANDNSPSIALTIQAPNDLTALSITGSLTPFQGVSTNYTVNVRNNGTITQTNYTVKLMSGTIELASVAGIAILPGATQAFIIPWTPASSGVMTIFGRVDLVGDENTANDNTATISLTIQAPNDLTALSITGNLTPFQGVSTDYTVNVRNNGSITQTNYTVKLMTGTTELVSVPGVSIVSGATQAVVVPWIPATSGAMTIFGKVVLVGDENTANDSSAPISLMIQSPNDLTALSVTGNLMPVQGVSSNYTVSVRNNGSITQTVYSVKLMSGTTELASVPGVSILAGATQAIVIPWVPGASGIMSIFGKVALISDENTANDSTTPISLWVLEPGTTAITIGDGSQDARMPVDMYYRNSLFETIYPSTEIGLPGTITGISLYNNFADNRPSMPTKIWMGNTTNTDLTAGWIPSTQLTSVFDGTVNYPLGLNTINIPFVTPFTYTGGNLVMMVQRPMDTVYYSSLDYFKCQTVGVNRTLNIWNDTTVFDPTVPPTGATLNGQFPKTTIYIAPSTADPVFSISPLSKDFGQVLMNQSATQSFTITNAGGMTLTIDSIVLTDGTMYQLQSLPTLPVSMYGGQSTTFGVIYAPTAAGTHPGTVTITDALTRTSHTVDLTGMCLDPTIYTLPYSQNFDSAVVPAIPWDWKKLMTNQTASTLVTSTASPHSGSNCTYYYNSSDAAANLLLIAPPLTATLPLTGIRTRFWAKADAAGYTLSVGVMSNPADAATYTEVQSIALTTAWTEYLVGFQTYAGSGLYVAYKHGLGGTYRGLYIDDVLLETTPQIDLGASSITGSSHPLLGAVNNYAVTIFNWGSMPQNNYQVKLFDIANTELGSVAGPVIPAGTQAIVQVPWTPSVQGAMYIYGKVVVAGDQVPANDQTSHLSINVPPAGITVVTIGDGSQTARMPMDFFYLNSLNETLYLQSELNSIGAITGISLYNNFADDRQNMPTKIWMGTTNLTDLSGGWIPSTALISVFDGTVSYPLGENIVNITFPTPFQYTTGNLVVMFDRPLDTVSYSASDLFYSQTTGVIRTLNIGSDGTTFNPAAPPATGATLTGQFAKTSFYINRSAAGHIAGTITNIGGTPLSNISVQITDGAQTVTNALGQYAFQLLLPGIYTVTAVGGGFYSSSQSVTVVDNATTQLNFILAPITTGGIPQYTFSQNLGTYTELTGGTVHGSNLNDNEVFNAVPVGFYFNYNGLSFNQVSICTNGFIGMGATVTNSNTALSLGTSNNVLAVANRDLRSRTEGVLSTHLTGTAPNRTFTIQWKNYRRYPTQCANDTLNFQINLYESTNIIKYAYGYFKAADYNLAQTVQVGLRGAANTEYLNRTTTTDWTATTAGTTNAANVRMNALIVPPNGLNFVWTPSLLPGPPSAATNPSPANGAANIPITSQISWQAGSGNPTSYKVYVGTNNPPTNIANGTIQTALTYDISTVAAYNTTYYWKIIPINTIGDALNCPIWQFTIDDGKATMPIPANGTINIAHTSTGLAWADVTGASSYKLKVGTTPGGNDIADMVSCAGSNWVNPVNWNYGSVYYWTVYTLRGIVQIAGDEWQFSTVAEPIASVTAALNTARSAVDLTWTSSGGARHSSEGRNPASPQNSKINLAVRSANNGGSTDQRSLQGYDVWRLQTGQEANPAGWTALSTGIAVPNYTDNTWLSASSGMYKYAVRAVYSGGIVSSFTLSNELDHIPPTGTITLTSPIDNAWRTATPYLDWTVSNFSDVSELAIVMDGSYLIQGLPTDEASSYYQIPVSSALSQGTHTWSVRGLDLSGNWMQSAQTWTIQVDTAAPAPFALSAPADSLWTSDNTPTLAWEAATDSGSGLSSYALSINGNTYPLASTELTFNAPVLPDGNYNWYVTATDLVGNVSQSITTRLIRIDTAAPSAVTLSSPANNAWTAESLVNFTWNPSSDGGAGFAHYELWIDDANVSGSITTTHYQLLPAQELSNGLHNWYVKAVDALGNSVSSNTFLLGIDRIAPQDFSLLLPANGSFFINPLPSFTWDIATDAGAGLSHYELWIDGILNVDDLMVPFAVAAQTLSEGQHSWYVVAVDVLGNRKNSLETWTVYGDWNPPTQPVLTSPINNQSLLYNSPFLTWDKSTDAGSGLSHYAVYLDGVLMLPSYIPADLNAQVVSVQVTNQLDNGDHTWYVIAYDNAGRESTSLTGAFVVNVATADIIPPTSSITNLAPDQYIGGESYLITGSASDNEWGTGVQRVEISVDGGSSWQQTTPTGNPTRQRNAGQTQRALLSQQSGKRTTDTASRDVFGWSFLWTGYFTDRYTVRTRAIDYNGNIETPPHSVIMNVDKQPPVVQSVTTTPNVTSTGTVSISITLQAGVHSGGLNYTIPPVVSIMPDGVNYRPVTQTSYLDNVWTGLYNVEATDVNGSTVIHISGAQDNLHNVMITDVANTFTVDTVAPIAFTLSSPSHDSWVNSALPTLSWNPALDATTAINHYELEIDGSTASPGIALITPTLNFVTPSAPLTPGAHNWRIKAVDTAGNYTWSSSAFNLDVDTTAPISTVTAPAGNGIIGGPAYLITGTATDGTGAGVSGITGVQIRLYDDTAGTWTNWLDTVNTGTGYSTWSYSWTGYHSGAYIVQSRALDFAGNTQDTPSITNLTVDLTAPAVQSLSVTPNPAKAGSITCTAIFSAVSAGLNHAVHPQVWFTTTEAGEVYFTETSYTGNQWTGTATILNTTTNGTATVHVSGATDNLNNVMAVNATAGSFVIDTVFPTVSAVTVTPAITGIRTDLQVQIQFGADLSGLNGSISPVINVIPSGTGTGSPIPVQQTAYDAVSGLWTGTAAITALSFEGAATVQITQVTDLAGNVIPETVGSTVFTIDRSAPQAFSILQPVEASWTTERLPQITWSPSSDNVSGLSHYALAINGSQIGGNFLPALTSYTLTNPLPDGIYQARVTAYDNANPANAQMSGTAPTLFHVDATAPVSVITAPAPGFVVQGSSIAVSGTALDQIGSNVGIGIRYVYLSRNGGSTWDTVYTAATQAQGIVNWQYTYTGLIPGNHTIAVKAEDWLGNAEVSTSSVTIFIQPNTPVANFSATPASGTAPLSVSFADLSTAGSWPITSWEWNFGDNSPVSTLPNPTHVYARGIYTVSLTVRDAYNTSASVTHTGIITATNQAPIVLTPMPDVAANEDFAPIMINLNTYFTDNDGDQLIYSVACDASQVNAVVAGSLLTLSPLLDYNGAANITITANDQIQPPVSTRRTVSHLRDTCSDTFILNIAPVNDTPTIAIPAAYTFAEDGSLIIDFAPYVSDIDNATLSLTATNSAHVSAAITGLTATLTAAQDWNGTESLSFTISDGSLSATAMTTVTVTPVNDAPVLDLPASFSFAEDGSLTVNIGLYTSDIDNSTLTLSATGNVNVTVAITGLGVTLGAAQNWNGSEELTFTVNDNMGRAIATDAATITVTPVNDAPLFDLPASFTFAEDGDLTVDFTQYCSDIDNAALTLSVAAANHVSAVITGLSVVFSSPDDWNGTESLTFTLSDGVTRATAIDIAQIIVTPVNDSPAITSFLPVQTAITAALNETLSFSVTATDIDSPLTYSWFINTVNQNITVDTFAHLFSASGVYEVKAVVSDGVVNVEQIWTVTVPVATDDHTTAPLTNMLYTNYPNPFNPRTTLSYDLKAASPVRIDIYNARGQLIRTLVNATKAPGHYSVIWDGKDARGNAVASGVYYSRMQAGSYAANQRMMLMK